MPPRKQKKIRNPDGTWSKRPVKQQILKRKQVEDEDGWTHVVGPHQNKIHETIDTNVVHIDRSLEDMSAQHEKTMKRWQESESRKVLATEIVEFEKTSHTKIKKIICLGLGTLSNGNFTQQNNRHAQLAALMDVVDFLGGLEQLTMVAQDPVFGPCDKAFLNFLGFQVVESPSAFEAIDGDTLVYAVHCHEEIYEEMAKASRPAIMIGNDLEQLRDSQDGSEWLKPFTNDYRDISVETVLSKRKERIDYFDQIFYSAFYATRLYLRKSSKPREPLQDTLLQGECSPLQDRVGFVSLETHYTEEDEVPENILETFGDEESSSEEDNVPIAPKSPSENFDIYEDSPDTDQLMQENPPTDVSEEDPIEDKENLPPAESELIPEIPSEGTRRDSTEIVDEKNQGNIHKRSSSINNWVPGLRLNALQPWKSRRPQLS